MVKTGLIVEGENDIDTIFTLPMTDEDITIIQIDHKQKTFIKGQIELKELLIELEVKNIMDLIKKI